MATGDCSSDQEIKYAKPHHDLDFECNMINEFIYKYTGKPLLNKVSHDKYIDLIYSNHKILNRGQVILFDGFLNTTLDNIQEEHDIGLIRVYNKGISTYVIPKSINGNLSRIIDSRPLLYQEAIQSLVQVFPECYPWINNRRSYGCKYDNFGWKSNIKTRRSYSTSYPIEAGTIDELKILRQNHVSDINKLHDLYLSLCEEDLWLHIELGE